MTRKKKSKKFLWKCSVSARGTDSSFIRTVKAKNEGHARRKCKKGIIVFDVRIIRKLR